MKYIITENRINNIITKYLEDKDFISKVDFSDNQIEIYLSKPKTLYPPNLGSYQFCENLAYEIKSLFGFEGVINFYRPSKTENYYLVIGHF